MILTYKPKAVKQVRKLPQREKQKIVRKLNELVTNPYLGKPLLGEYQGCYSLRAWPYRVIYQIHSNEILVLSISHRQSAYN